MVLLLLILLVASTISIVSLCFALLSEDSVEFNERHDSMTYDADDYILFEMAEEDEEDGDT